MRNELAILVVDDEVAVLNSICKMIELSMSDERYVPRILRATSAIEAQDFLKKEPIAAIFLDYHFTDGMSGDELLDRIERFIDRTQVVLLSGRPEEELGPVVEKRHRSMGVRFRFLQKPITQLTLKSCLLQLIAHLDAAPDEPTTIFSWLHLSDIHFGHGRASHAWDQQLVISALHKDLGSLVKKVPPLNAIFVTGDIAFSGKEYDKASSFLTDIASHSKLTTSDIFLVPGNHDVDRSNDKKQDVKRLLVNLRDGSEEIDDALRDPNDRRRLSARQKKFLRFAANFAPGCYEGRATSLPLFWTQKRKGALDTQVRLIGFNTALLSMDDQDQGRLRLGKEQLALALRDPVQTNEILLVLTHHPFRDGWLADEKSSDAWIRGHAHLHLSGHVHESGVQASLVGASGPFVWLSAGAVHGEAGQEPTHGYNVSALIRKRDGHYWVRTWLRRWSSRFMAFRMDAENLAGESENSTFVDHPVMR